MLTACQTSSSRFDNSIVLSVLLICSCFIFSASQSFASDIRFNDLTKSISLTGDIEVGDSEKLKRAIERVPQNLIFTLSLDSDGGSLQEAKKIANLLNNYNGGFKTLISPGHSFSSCALIFMQGRAHDGDGYSSNNRSMSITSLLGFHAPFFGELSDGNYDKQQMLLAHKAAQLELEWIISTNEIPDDLLLEMMKAGPSDAYEIKYVWQGSFTKCFS